MRVAKLPTHSALRLGPPGVQLSKVFAEVQRQVPTRRGETGRDCRASRREG